MPAIEPQAKRADISSSPLHNRGGTGRETERARIFISYSRDDLDFADQLVIGLEFAGFSPIIDRRGISGGEDWKQRLTALIRESETVVFVLSPASAASEICAWEVREASAHAKRIIPVICRPLKQDSRPAHLSSRSYIYFYTEPKFPGSGFAAGLIALTDALNTDLEWLREHSRILIRALEWDKGDRRPARLLSGGDVQAATDWARKRPRNAPELTDLQLAFIRASEEEVRARDSAEAARLSEIAAAQDARAKALAEAESALREAEDSRRRRARLRNALLVLMTFAAGLSGWSWYAISQGNRDLAKQIQLATSALNRAKAAERRARLDQGRARRAEFDAIINECTASEQLLKATPEDIENLHNYLNCGVRLGFALIREGQNEDASKYFSRLRDVSLDSFGKDDPITSFYLLLISQGKAVAICKSTAPKSTARSDAISSLVTAAEKILHFVPPQSARLRWSDEFEQRWREEMFRGFLYISNLSKENGDDEIAFQFAYQLVERLSGLPSNKKGNLRDLARALDHLSWMALLTKRYQIALDASERAKAIVDENGINDLVALPVNYAHALLFNSKEEDARKVYLGMDPDELVSDFRNLISAGVCHRLFEELVGVDGRCVSSRS